MNSELSGKIDKCKLLDFITDVINNTENYLEPGEDFLTGFQNLLYGYFNGVDYFNLHCDMIGKISKGFFDFLKVNHLWVMKYGWVVKFRLFGDIKIVKQELLKNFSFFLKNQSPDVTSQNLILMPNSLGDLLTDEQKKLFHELKYFYDERSYDDHCVKFNDLLCEIKLD